MAITDLALIRALEAQAAVATNTQAQAQINVAVLGILADLQTAVATLVPAQDAPPLDDQTGALS